MKKFAFLILLSASQLAMAGNWVRYGRTDEGLKSRVEFMDTHSVHQRGGDEVSVTVVAQYLYPQSGDHGEYTDVGARYSIHCNSMTFGIERMIFTMEGKTIYDSADMNAKPYKTALYGSMGWSMVRLACGKGIE